MIATITFLILLTSWSLYISSDHYQAMEKQRITRERNERLPRVPISYFNELGQEPRGQIKKQCRAATSKENTKTSAPGWFFWRSLSIFKTE